HPLSRSLSPPSTGQKALRKAKQPIYHDEYKNHRLLHFSFAFWLENQQQYQEPLASLPARIEA
ncbi:MAG: hypothetical protein ACOVS5_02025, partial [Oligoflexus sp.]